NIYDFQTQRITPNDQGWGLVNLPNSIPEGMSVNAGSTVFFDQSLSNALATGDSRTWTVTPTDPYSPMRFSLVWTDPAGNPAAGVKLVNDLDLIITNLETGEVFVGNNFQEGNVFTSSDDPAFGSITPSDTVNNVENVYVFGSLGLPLGSNYTVTVRGTHVNVNAVTEHPNNIVQDFALVISGGDRPVVTNLVSDITPTRLVTVASNSVALLYQRVGANSPLISTPGTGLTNGTISQWHFFVFTNNVDFTKTNATNVAIVTFLPPNLSQSRLEEPPGVAPRNEDFGADIDLYVSTNAALLDLDPNAIAAADKSTERGGTEFVTYTNSFSNAVYYVGVKSEDQQAAEFGFIALATDKAFGGLDANGQLEINFVPVPIVIPDGDPALPSRPPALSVGVVVPTGSPRQKARRVVISQSITHELLGDLYGTVEHNGRRVVLNNHRASQIQTGATNFVCTYDDLDEGDVTTGKGYPGHMEQGAQTINYSPDWMHTDGPGSLKDYVDKRIVGVWLYTMTDNALNHTGQVNTVHGWIEPAPETNVLHQVRTIAGNGWFYDFLDLPDDVTNLNIAVTYQAGSGPVDIYLRKNFFPTPTTYDAAALGIGAPGGALNVNISNTPPISGGFWIYGIHNNNGTPVTIAIDITITRSLTPDLIQTVTNKTGTVLLDDAITTSQILISNALPVVGVEVGLRLDHPRLSDLSIELISPQGTHVMLFEDRGYTDATGFGLDDGTNNTVYTIFTEDTNRASQLIKFALPPYAKVTALVTNRVISSDGFDAISEGAFPAGSIVDGWTVTTNQLGIEFEPELNTSPSNYVALGSAGMTKTIATQVGKSYLVTHTYHGPNVIDWWTADGNVKDLINPSNDGTFTNLNGTQPLYTAGEVNEAWHFDGANTEVIINTNACNFGTNDFTIEFWIQSVSLVEMGIMEKRPVCDSTESLWSIRMGPAGPIGQQAGEIGIEVSSNNHADYASLVSTNSRISDGVWHHVAFRRDEGELDIYVDGQLNAQTIVPAIAFISNSVPMIMGQSICQCCDGTKPFAGNLDEVTVYQRSLSPAEIYDIYAAGRAGKRTTTSILPNISYIIDGVTNDTLVSGPGNSLFVTGPGDAWQTNTIGFTATNSATQITIKGNPLGMLLDDVILKELPNTNYANYFFPEESLSAFNGELALGYWTLEIHDARGGQAGKLLDWELNLTYSSTNVNMITVVPGTTNCTTAPAGGYAYFAVDVPALAKFATNTLLTAGPNPLNLIFNQTSLPTGYSPGDFYLMANVGTPGAIQVLSKNSGPPFLVPGQRYFLAVQNLSAQDQPFCLQVDFDINTNFTITSLNDSVTNPITTNVIGGSVQYYYFDVTNNLAVFQVTNMSADVDMVIRHTLPLPDAQSYDYGSFQAGTNNEFIVVRTNSSPVPLAPGRWYVTVMNNVTNPTVTYTIFAYQSDDAVNVFGLNAPADCVEFTAQPGPAVVDTVFAFTVSDSPRAVEFDLTGIAGNSGVLAGNVDLLVRLNAYPTPSQFDYASFNAGNSDEKIVVTTNSSVPSLNGTWYLGIQNDEVFAVDYKICATETNSTVPFPAFASASAAYTPGRNGAFMFSWSSIAGQTYYIDRSTNLVNWSTIATIRAQSSTTTFSDPAPADTARYYRLHTQ
ncbi:MAG: Peptidase and in kexin sedolisin, partial [Verrucomicrobiales bacterium]|nr:Peptidase and in kexin sedolisin [Verrucomicrobiales bacterium]